MHRNSHACVLLCCNIPIQAFKSYTVFCSDNPHIKTISCGLIVTPFVQQNQSEEKHFLPVVLCTAYVYVHENHYMA